MHHGKDEEEDGLKQILLYKIRNVYKRQTYDMWNFSTDEKYQNKRQKRVLQF